MPDETKGERLQTLSFYDTLTTIIECAGLFENSTGNVSPIAKPNESNEACNVYFMHQLSLKEPPSYSHSTGGIASNVYPDSSSQIKTTLFDINESMPSLMPLRLFTSMQSLATVEADADVHMHHSTKTLPIPTTGSMPYHGPSHHDGRTVITFDRLTQSDAEGYLSTDYAKFNNYHSPYIPNVVHAIESFCFCQDELIANDWNIHLFRDETYPGHVVIPGDTKLSTGGPRSGRTWQERI
jgi:hypothetical protein